MAMSAVLIGVVSSGVFGLDYEFTGDNIEHLTFITGHDGGIYEATVAGLQSALTVSIGEWVEIPGNTSISLPVGGTSFIIGSGTELRGGGHSTVLTQDDNANLTIIKNLDITNGNPNITIKNLRIECNGLNQPEWYKLNAPLNAYAWGIDLQKCDFFTIDDVVINNTLAGGILATECDWSKITDCTFTNMGKIYKDSGNDKHAYYCGGAYFYTKSDNNLISNCIVNNSYAWGFVIEGTSSAHYSDWCSNTIIENCIVSDTEYGYYFEDARNCIVDNCIAIDCLDGPVYGSSAGFQFAQDTKYITVSDSQAYNCTHGVRVDIGNDLTFNNVYTYNSVTNGFMSVSATTGIKLNGCKSFSSGEDGYEFKGIKYLTMSDCDADDSGAFGIYVEAYDSKIDGCFVNKSVNSGIYSRRDNITISNNDVHDSDDYGIYINGGDNISLKNNKIKDVVDWGIYIRNSNHGDASFNNVANCEQWGVGIGLDNSYRYDVIGNTVHGVGGKYPANGIYETGGSDYNFITLNRCTQVNNDVVKAGSNTICTKNIGYNYSNLNHFGDTTDYIGVGSTGVLTMYGDARILRHVRVTAPSWKCGATAPCAGQVGTFPVYAFDSSSDDEAWYSLIIPWRIEAGSTINVTIDWCYTGGNDAGTVCWNLSYLCIEPGEAVGGANTTIGTVTDGSHTSGNMYRTTLSTGITGAVANDIIGMRLWRDVSEDTLSTNAHMLQVHFAFTADKLGKPI